MIQFQNTFFPDTKGAFNAERFINEQLCEPLREWISTSIQAAFSNVQQMCDIQGVTTRVKSDVLHDAAFSQIMQNKSMLPEHMTPEFFSDCSGNKKQVFELNGYYYVIKKSGVVSNGTKIDKAIQNQELTKHVITIEYAIDSFWNSVSSISFKYIKGDGIELDYILQPQSNTTFINNNTNPESIEETSISTYKPHFKSDNIKNAL